MTVRQRILSYLRKQNGVSAAEIGRSLKLSAPNVRHHLSILLADGRIAQVGEARLAGRGRPIKLYGLSQKLLGDNLAPLLDAILNEWLAKLPQDERKGALNVLANQITQPCLSVDRDMPLMKKLVFIVDGLNRMNYRSRWEAGAEGPRILFGHCPYAAIIDKHPELCEMDADLLSNCFGGSARQISKIGREGATQCTFSLGRS